MVTFREKISKLIGESSRAKIARAAGVPATVVTTYVNRGSEPSAANVLKLAKAFGVTADWLIDDAQDWPPSATTGTALTSVGDVELIREVLRRRREGFREADEQLKRVEAVEWAHVAKAFEAKKASDNLPPDLQKQVLMLLSAVATFCG